MAEVLDDTSQNCIKLSFVLLFTVLDVFPLIYPGGDMLIFNKGEGPGLFVHPQKVFGP